MIIQRDYYPSLTDLERQSAVLERRLHGDVPGAVAVRRAARKLANHDEALAQQEEEDEHDLIDGARKQPRPLHLENLTGFHARATNEDDHEFDSQQKQEVQANRERLEELFRPPKNDTKMIEMSDLASDQFLPESNRTTDYQQPNMRNGLFFSPTPLLKGGNDEGSGESQTLLTNGGTTDSNLQLTMPPPPSKQPSKTKSAPKLALVEYIPKHSLEKNIEPSQTRFPAKIVPYGASRVVLDTKVRRHSDTEDLSTDASTDLDAPLRSIGDERKRRERKNTKDHQSYVNMTPLLVPGAGNQSPITTWGTVDSTPLVISGNENPDDGFHSTSSKSSFSVAAESGRERAARKAENELERRAKRARSTMTGSQDKHSGTLTPAAMSFLEKHGRSTSRQKDAFASALRGSYTPKVRSLREGSSKRRSARDHAHNATPVASRSQKR
jgi:protein DGCR14